MREDTLPWYKQFWPWFIICMLGSVVIASLITVYIAVDGSDDLVNDNYYKDGLAINMELVQDELARELAIKAEITVTEDNVTIDLNKQGALPDWLVLKFFHPASDKQDQHVELKKQADGRYLADNAIPHQRFYLRLNGVEGEKTWRLNGEIDLRSRNSVKLSAPGN